MFAPRYFPKVGSSVVPVYGPLSISACETYNTPGAAFVEASVIGPSAIEIANSPAAAAVEAIPI